MRDALVARGWLTADEDAALRDQVGREVEQATEAAEAAADPDAASLTRHVYADA
jgi:TPP-dependent pyruvate/acetoin dehydrogenase alpha subunit